MAARQHAEETLNVQKVAGQAMLQRLQSRSAECTALQRQLSARAVELVHAREERIAMKASMEATTSVLANEVSESSSKKHAAPTPFMAHVSVPTVDLAHWLAERFCAADTVEIKMVTPRRADEPARG